MQLNGSKIWLWSGKCISLPKISLIVCSNPTLLVIVGLIFVVGKIAIGPGTFSVSAILLREKFSDKVELYYLFEKLNKSIDVDEKTGTE